jgi:hypothetical protein
MCILSGERMTSHTLLGPLERAYHNHWLRVNILYTRPYYNADSDRCIL